MIPGARMCFGEMDTGQTFCKVCNGYATGSDFWTVVHAEGCPVPFLVDARVSVTMACTKYDRDNYPVSDLETEEFSEVSYATEWAVHAAILTEKDRDTDDPRLEALRYVVEVPEEALMVGKAVTEAVVKYRQEKHQAELAKEAAAEKTRQLAACRGALTNLAKMQDELRPEAYAKRLAELRVKYASVYDEAVGA